MASFAGRTRFIIAALTGIAVGVLSIANQFAPAAAGQPVTNGAIVFTRMAQSYSTIFTMQADGSEPTGLAGGLGGAYSPDGRKIAYRDEARDGLSVMNANGTAPRLAVAGMTGVHLSWSPDGSQFMWSGPLGDAYGIAVANVDGSNVHALSTGGRDFDGSWSPDGTQVVFVRADAAGAQSDIWTEQANGTSSQQIVAVSGARAATPRFSPDGERIVFSAEFGSEAMSGIFLVNRDGSGLHRVGPTSGWNLEPTFSPDGTSLAFTVDDYHFGVVGKSAGIYTMSSDGTNVRQLTNDRDMFPDWQRSVAGPAIESRLAPVPSTAAPTPPSNVSTRSSSSHPTTATTTVSSATTTTVSRSTTIARQTPATTVMTTAKKHTPPPARKTPSTSSTTKATAAKGQDKAHPDRPKRRAP